MLFFEGITIMGVALPPIILVVMIMIVLIIVKLKQEAPRTEVSKFL